MHNEIGPAVLGFLSAVFAVYGIRELAFAYYLLRVSSPRQPDGT